MIKSTKRWRTIVGAAVASAIQKDSTPKYERRVAYHTVRPRRRPAPLPAEAHRVSTTSEVQVKEFKRFYETVTRSKEAKSLLLTPLGYGGSERILNNEFLHRCPWQASCVELRERAVETETRVFSYSNIDFSALREQSRRKGLAAGGRGSSLNPSSRGTYYNVEDMFFKSNQESGPKKLQGPGLEVVHYYETSTQEGLAGYQSIALKVRKQQLPGSCTNFSAEGGFAVWVVSLDEYIEILNKMGCLPE
ncbi:hypothetical protein JKF63_06210 [Porcisia hertigi]|uniref:Uncharacterized protein n=1 Tax=Porcisia hertigi TaxID=2761500 RepID=A0A836IPL5_9TRYP|nr:hypothetical protein JKF63_06210 [Porcisia hertigi]